MMHVYAFGSICRGDISADSDVDLLAIVNGLDSRLDADLFSIYSYRRIFELWREGNPFAWHLFLESKLLSASDNVDFLRALGKPAFYKSVVADCTKFFDLFREANQSVISTRGSIVFDLSAVFLSIRNIATCFSLGISDRPDFSRSSALHLGQDSVPLSSEVYRILERARILSTRGQGANLTQSDIRLALSELPKLANWMSSLIDKARLNARIQ